MIRNIIKKQKSYIVIIGGLLMIGLTAFNDGRVTHHQILSLTDTTKIPAKFGFGRVVTQQEIDKWDIDVRPDGKGLPAGEGDAAKGKAIYVLKCIACHGATGEDIGLGQPGGHFFQQGGFTAE